MAIIETIKDVFRLWRKSAGDRKTYGLVRTLRYILWFVPIMYKTNKLIVK